MPQKIIVLAEHWEGKFKNSTWEAIGLAQTLADKNTFSISVVILGKDIDNLAAHISEKTNLEVINIFNEHCQYYTPEVYCDLLLQVIRQTSPFLVLMGHSCQAIDFAPKLALMLDRGFISNCIGIKIESDRMVFVRSVYGGKFNQEVSLKGDPPYIISLQQGRFNQCLFTDVQVPKVVKLDIHLNKKLFISRKVLDIIQDVQRKIDLAKAEIIVSGGRGIGSKENFKIIFDLAKALGASVGATRPVIDNGWLPKDHQVGSSGNSVAPKLYIACGISGQIQHLVGIMNTDCIVAINKDPYAPIFRVADYGIVGDLFLIVPAITQSAKEIGNFLQVRHQFSMASLQTEK